MKIEGTLLNTITLILLSAGNATRFHSEIKKQWIRIGDIPLWLHVARTFEKARDFDEIIIVSSAQELAHMEHFAPYTYSEGGKDRQASLQNALQKVTTSHVLVSDVARACVPSEMIVRICDAKTEAGCIVPTLDIVDTLYHNATPIEREACQIIQTPQLSKTDLLRRALETETRFSDESSAIASLGEKVHFVQGSDKAHKLTSLADLQRLSCLKAPASRTLVGFGIDTHPFEKGKKMFLCGLPIESDEGFKAHSDGDVAIHALIDALLGAAGMGDIGELFPDTDATYAGVDSNLLLEETVNRINSFGYTIINVDLTIVAESPKISPYKMQMRSHLSKHLNVEQNFVNIKATTAEKLGFIGRKEGVTVHAVANLTYTDWTQI